jgi:mycothiol synthase
MKPENPQLDARFTTRPATLEDTGQVHELFTEYWRTLTGVTKFTLEEFQQIFSAPGFEIGESTLLVLSPTGEVIGCMVVIDLAQPPVHPRAYGCVRRGYENQGIGTYLLDWAERRARQAIKRVPEGVRLSMELQTSISHQPTADLFESLEFTPVRYSWIMGRELDQPPPEPVLPKGIHILTYQDFPQPEAILAAADEAFEDHWGHVDRRADQERIERFRHSIENDESFDPTLWYLAMDGEQIAGVSLCSAHFGGDRSTGVVETLGVRRSWRRQGLGLALLYLPFNEFHQRGYQQVILGVDTQNLTGATRLYEKAGMRVDREYAVYEKELRPGEELARQEL